MGVSLIEGEKILKKTHPHFLSMFHLYVMWGFLIFFGIATIQFREPITVWIHELPQGKSLFTPIFFALWGSMLLFPAVIISFFRINFRWFFFSVALFVSGIIAFAYRAEITTGLQGFIQNSSWLANSYAMVEEQWSLKEILRPDEIHNYLLTIVGFIGLIASNSYRRSHRYYLTNRRIIARFGFVSKRERDLLYSKIDDLVLQQDLLGRIFNYVTIIPISASGMGTGSDQVLAMGGLEAKIPGGPTMKVTIGGGRSVTIPRAPSFYALYGVSSPQEIKSVILKEMDRREYGYTRRMKDLEEAKKLSE